MPKIVSPADSHLKDFDIIHRMILTTQEKVWRAANAQLVQLYWRIGKYISIRIKNDGWGQGTVQSLADYINLKTAMDRGKLT